MARRIVHRRIVRPDAPALGPVLTISPSELRVMLDRRATGPTRIASYELDRSNNGTTWVRVATGLGIWGSDNDYEDAGLQPVTTYTYRCRAVDTTSRRSEYSYSSGTTGTGVVNQPPVWSAFSLTIEAGNAESIVARASDPEGVQLAFSRVGGTAPSGVTCSVAGIVTVPSGTTAGAYTLTLRASDGSLTADTTVNLTVTVVSTGTATYIVQPTAGTRTFNGASGAGWGSFGPSRAPTGGDIIELAPGAHGPLIFNNLRGTSDGNRITVRNGNGQVVITSSVTNVVEYSGCQYVDFVFDNGSVDYGLKIQATSSSSAFDKGIKAEGDNSYVRWAYVEIDGKRTSWTSAVQPIGFFGHHQNTQRSGGLFQQDHIVVDHCYIHNMSGEGIYFGPNYSNGSRPLRNIEVAHNLITDCGRDGFQGKCWFEGTNSVHDNEVWRCGRNTADTQAGQRFGLSINSGKADFYNNKIYESGESGIQVFTQNGPTTSAFQGYGPYSSFDCRIYNNLIVDSGVIDNAPVNTGHGLTLGAGSASYCLPRGYVYNNTVVGSEGDGISFGSNSNAGWIRNNVLLNNTGGAYSAGSSSATNNKTTGSVSASYRLTSEDAAVGSIGTDISATDLDGVSRAGTASKGCYEYA